VKGNPLPSIAGVSPSTLNRLQTANVTLTGSGFISGITTASFGSDVAINSVTVSSTTQLVVNVTVSASAATGTRTISVTNDAPGGGTGSLSNGITISNPAPTLTGIVPAAGNRLQTLTVSFAGTNFISGVTSIVLGTGITLNSITLNSSTSLSANITIAAGAPTGSQTFTVTNSAPGGGTSGSQSFTVNNPVPTLTNLSPATGNRLQTLTVTLTGTNFIGGVTTINVGQGIAINSLTVNSSTSLSASLLVADTAATGARDFTVTNTSPGGGTSTAQTFAINNPVPSLSLISPAGATRGQALEVRVKGSNFLRGLTSAGFGSNISVDSSIVYRSDSLGAYIRVGATATIGSRNVTATNVGPGGGTTVLANGFTVFGSVVGVPAMVSLGSVKLGEFKDSSVTITNAGNDTLRVSNTTSTNNVFSIRPISTTIPPSLTAYDTIRFAPTAIGLSAGNILIFSNSASSPDTIKTSAYAFGRPVFQSNKTRIQFDTLKIGTFRDSTMTITNIGNDTLKISNITISNVAFSARPSTRNLPPNGSFADTIRFSPAAVGTISGNILIFSNGASSPDTIGVAGFGSGLPRLQTITAIVFGDVRLSMHKDTSIVLANVGSDTLRIASIASSRSCFSSRPSTMVVAPGRGSIDTIRFTPDSSGTRSAFIVISSNDPTSPDTIMVSGDGTTTGIRRYGTEIPNSFALLQNFPNPFNPTTTISFDLPEGSHVNISIYDAIGRKVETLADEEKSAGRYRITFDASAFPSGVYFCRLSAGHFVDTKKLMFLK